MPTNKKQFTFQEGHLPKLYGYHHVEDFEQLSKLNEGVETKTAESCFSSNMKNMELKINTKESIAAMALQQLTQKSRKPQDCPSSMLLQEQFNASQTLWVRNFV